MSIPESLRAMIAAQSPAPLPPGFEMRSDGLYEVRKSKSKSRVTDNEKQTDEAYRLTLTPFDVIARVTDEKSEHPGTLIRWKDEAGADHETIVRDEDVHADSKVLNAMLARQNLRITAMVGASLRVFFSLLESANRTTTYTRAGWHADGTVFLLPNGTVIGDRRAILLGAKPGLHQQRSDLTAWRDNVASLATGNSRLMMALNLAFTGPLLEPTGEGFSGFHFVGSSSTGKSTALFLSGSVWGAPTRDVIRSWRATDNGLEAVAGETSDTALYLDEMGQASAYDLAGIVYMLGNGCGKSRMSRDGSAREARQWRANVVSTGETTIEAAQRSIRQATPGGLDVRMINLPADAGHEMGMFQHLHGRPTPAQFADDIRKVTSEHHGVAGVVYLETLAAMRAADPDGFYKAIRARMDAFAQRHTPKAAAGSRLSGQVSRVVSKFSLVAAAGEIAIAAGILPQPEGAAEAAAVECLSAWLAARGGVSDREDNDILARVRAFIVEYATSRFDGLNESPL